MTPSDSASKHAIKSDIVSSESEQLILVDEHDRQTGALDKSAAHDGNGVLHRAFSLFVFNAAGELLLQQRAASKRLWPLYWSNTCCSHPRDGETMDYAVTRRLEQELGMQAELHYLYKFQYQAQFLEIGSEHELCSVYIGSSTDPAELDRRLQAAPEDFTPWFRLEWQALSQNHASALAALTSR